MNLATTTINEPAEKSLVIKQQLDLERPCPGRPAPPWLSNGTPNTTPSIQTTEEV